MHYMIRWQEETRAPKWRELSDADQVFTFYTYLRTRVGQVIGPSHTNKALFGASRSWVQLYIQDDDVLFNSAYNFMHLIHISPSKFNNCLQCYVPLLFAHYLCCTPYSLSIAFYSFSSRHDESSTHHRQSASATIPRCILGGIHLGPRRTL